MTKKNRKRVLFSLIIVRYNTRRVNLCFDLHIIYSSCSFCSFGCPERQTVDVINRELPLDKPTYYRVTCTRCLIGI